MAERVGFEPTEPIGVHLISSQARSASSGTSPREPFRYFAPYFLAVFEVPATVRSRSQKSHGENGQFVPSYSRM